MVNWLSVSWPNVIWPKQLLSYEMVNQLNDYLTLQLNDAQHTRKRYTEYLVPQCRVQCFLFVMLNVVIRIVLMLIVVWHYLFCRRVRQNEREIL
jgi:hypothetical protein